MWPSGAARLDGAAERRMVRDSRPEIRRVEYDVEQEIKDLDERAFPHADWIARTLRSASPQRP